MRKILAAIAMVVMMCGLAITPAWADQWGNVCDNNLNPEAAEAAGCSETRTATGVVKTVINVVIGVVGVIAVIMIVVAGIRMTVSQGDAGKVAQARNTIIYAVIGLVIAILAFAIVNFVLTSVF